MVLFSQCCWLCLKNVLLRKQKLQEIDSLLKDSCFLLELSCFRCPATQVSWRKGRIAVPGKTTCYCQKCTSCVSFAGYS